MSANPPINHHQWQPDSEQQEPSQNYALTGKIMLSSIIILFVIVFVLVVLHLYARWYLIRFQLRRRNRHRRRRSTRIVFYVDGNRSPPASSTAGGLDGAVLKSLPVFVYSPENDETMPECAVCLSEFVEGETGRVLPKCKHCFHTDCIDMWFGSHSTCPLCRSPVEAGEPEMTIPVEPSVMTGPGSSGQRVEEIVETTSFSDRMKRVDVRIDVPNRNELAAGNEFTEFTEFRLLSPSQGFRSPGSRLLSFKRIMNMSRKSPVVSPASGVGPSSLPVAAESDLESARQEPTQESSRPG